MGRFAFASAEPRDDDGAASANGRVVGEAAELAGKEQGRLASFLKSSDMGAMQVNLRRALRGRDLNLPQFAIPFGQRDASRDFESFPSIELRQYAHIRSRRRLPVPYSTTNHFFAP